MRLLAVSLFIMSCITYSVQNPLAVNHSIPALDDASEAFPQWTQTELALNSSEHLNGTSPSGNVIENVAVSSTEETLVDDNLVEDTLRLIDEGDRRIQSNKAHVDVILVLGNSGAGKTTITKFIANLEDLESYDAGDRYLIRDKDHKISENSTLVSKTIFPDLAIHNASNTALYDLPGFGDTRNASVEIANAWFMKRVADAAERVKLLFIVNYKSFLTGETRTDFKTFLEHASDLIKDPSKFNSSIALVATKVESTRSPEKIINGIASFLTSIKNDLPQVFPEGAKRQAAEDLIDAMLSKNADGHHSQISYFQQPEEEGPIKNISYVMSRRPHILNVVFNNTQFAGSSSDDFGFSVSPESKLVLLKVAQKINLDFTTVFENISQEMSATSRSKVEQSPLENIGELLTQQKKIGGIVFRLSASLDREDFMENLNKILGHVNAEPFQGDLQLVRSRSENLKFFEKINNQAFPASTADWTSPFVAFANELRNATSGRLKQLNTRIEADCIQMSSSLTNRFKTLVQSTGVDIPKMERTLQVLVTAGGKSLEMVRSLEEAKSVKDFERRLKLALPAIDQSALPKLISLTEDVSIEDEDKSAPSFLSLPSWLRPFNQLSALLTNEQSKLKIKIQNEKNRLEAVEAERRRKVEQEELERQRREREEQERLAREEAERRRQEHEAHLRAVQEQQQREQEAAQQALNELMRRQSMRRKRRRGWGGHGVSFSFRF